MLCILYFRNLDSSCQTKPDISKIQKAIRVSIGTSNTCIIPICKFFFPLFVLTSDFPSQHSQVRMEFIHRNCAPMCHFQHLTIISYHLWQTKGEIDMEIIMWLHTLIGDIKKNY